MLRPMTATPYNTIIERISVQEILMKRLYSLNPRSGSIARSIPAVLFLRTGLRLSLQEGRTATWRNISELHRPSRESPSDSYRTDLGNQRSSFIGYHAGHYCVPVHRHTDEHSLHPIFHSISLQTVTDTWVDLQQTNHTSIIGNPSTEQAT